MTSEDIDLFFDQEPEFWRPRKIWHDRRIKPSEHLPFMPDEVRGQMIRHKVATNRPWVYEHLQWLKSDTEGLFFVDGMWVMFEKAEDMALFVLRFEGDSD